MTGLLPGLKRSPDASPDDAGRLNWLRAGVLGSNDGIVSVAAIVVGVAGATAHGGSILTAGLAALIGGALSMALGEYVSVSSQRDSQRAAGRIDSGDQANPFTAAAASAFSFLVGGILPLLAMVLLPEAVRIPVTFLVVMLALAATGAAGAYLGGAPAGRATIRVVVGGALALIVTFGIGRLLGSTGVV